MSYVKREAHGDPQWTPIEMLSKSYPAAITHPVDEFERLSSMNDYENISQVKYMNTADPMTSLFLYLWQLRNESLLQENNNINADLIPPQYQQHIKREEDCFQHTMDEKTDSWPSSSTYLGQIKTERPNDYIVPQFPDHLRYGVPRSRVEAHTSSQLTSHDSESHHLSDIKINCRGVSNEIMGHALAENPVLMESSRKRPLENEILPQSFEISPPQIKAKKRRVEGSSSSNFKKQTYKKRRVEGSSSSYFKKQTADKFSSTTLVKGQSLETNAMRTSLNTTALRELTSGSFIKKELPENEITNGPSSLHVNLESQSPEGETNKHKSPPQLDGIASNSNSSRPQGEYVCNGCYKGFFRSSELVHHRALNLCLDACKANDCGICKTSFVGKNNDSIILHMFFCHPFETVNLLKMARATYYFKNLVEPTSSSQTPKK